MVESLGVPFDQGEFFSVVIGVAAGALLTGARRNVIGRVKPFASGNAAANFGVAIYAFECCLAAKLVTGGTVGRSA